MSGPFDAIAGLLAKLPFADRFEGARAVSRRELISNLKSIRMIVITALMGLAIVGGSFGITGAASSGGANTANVFFAHPVLPFNNGTYSIEVFAADAYGRPHHPFTVVLADLVFSTEGGGGFGPPGSGGGGVSYKPIAEAQTDAAGWARFDGLRAVAYGLGINNSRTEQFEIIDFFTMAPAPGNDFHIALHQFDLGQNGSNGHIVMQAAAFDGTPMGGAQVRVDGVGVGALDAQGYGHFIIGPGASRNITVQSASLSAFEVVAVREPNPTAIQRGPDFILYIVAAALIPVFVPIATIAIAHDAIAREKANGSIDFILSRPATRKGLLLGKLIGSTGALLVPVYITILLGAMVIGGVSGQAFSWSFLAAIYLAVTIYVASYSLLLLMLSTLAKTTGTAIMFGVLLWVLYNLLWNLVVFLVTSAAGLSVASPDYAAVQAYIGLFNLNDLYSQVVGSAYPGAFAAVLGGSGGEILPSWAPLAAALAWLVGLFVVALQVFERKVAE